MGFSMYASVKGEEGAIGRDIGERCRFGLPYRLRREQRDYSIAISIKRWPERGARA